MADSSKSRIRGVAGTRMLPDGNCSGTEHASVNVILLTAGLLALAALAYTVHVILSPFVLIAVPALIIAAVREWELVRKAPQE